MDLIPTDLRCEYLQDPLGVDTMAPRLSWKLQSDRRCRMQSGYQVLVASDPSLLLAGKADLWDSGHVHSEQNIHVEYAGQPLQARQRCFWKVRVWDQEGRVGPYSEVARWEMGLLDEGDWSAQWIGAPQFPPRSVEGVCRAPLLRKTFSLQPDIDSARVYICGLGYYELYVNGTRIGDRRLDPAFTRYDRRALYTAYDVTAALKKGANAIGVILGNGYYNQHLPDVWGFEHAPWRDYPKLILQLHVRFADGSETAIVTDPSWKAYPSPIMFDQLRSGEVYDAREEIPGWNTPEFDDTEWHETRVVAGPGGRLISQMTPPIEVTEDIPPIAVNEVAPGVFVYDMGQSFSGWVQLRVRGPAGTRITLRYSELRSDDGNIDQSNIKTLVKGERFQTDIYTLKGEGVEVWEPRFTYHGFRYVEMTGFPGRPDLDSLRGRFVHTAFEPAGRFSCSNELLNRIQECTLRSYRSNFVGIPTDCPHREKNGWTGDAHIAAETGLFNFKAAASYAKWMHDFADEQRPSGQLPGYIPTAGKGYNWGSGPAWDSAYILIPWYLYLYCGDKRVLEQHYSAMKRYVDFMGTMATDHILHFGLGDWCPPGRPSSGHKTPTSVTSTGYYYVDVLLLSKIADLLGHHEDAAAYKTLADKIKKAFNKHFYDPKTGRYAGEAQTSMACALYQGLVEPDEKDKVLEQLLVSIDEQNGHIDCGILGTKYVMNTLTDHGRTDVAYRIATKTTYPSWGYWLAQGATTLWESWDGINSRNHIMFGDIGAWFYKALAGINPDPESPGFKHTIIRPHPVDDLEWVSAEHHTMYGTIVSSWKKQGDDFTLRIRIPVNTTATVWIPSTNPDSVLESGRPATEAEGVRFLHTEDGYCLYAVGSGEYFFSA
ncbi:MAG: family 78 glycoside hydrolase catalytic domain [Firmicutes bacterium]|nr:family 78 glycoside hydrolase catalytic domain [Bacillota bacterium]